MFIVSTTIAQWKIVKRSKPKTNSLFENLHSPSTLLPSIKTIWNDVTIV